MVEADVEVEASQGRIDRRPGRRRAALHVRRSIWPPARPCSVPRAWPTSPRRPRRRSASRASYRVALANFDDQLLLWVDGTLVDFDGQHASTTRTRSSAAATQIIPQTSDADPGDLAPVGIGARGAKLAVTRLQVWRDIYYIADSWKRRQLGDADVITDFDTPFDERACSNLPVDPSLWDAISRTAAGRVPARRGPVLRDGRQQPGKLRRPAVARRRRPRPAAGPAARTWNGSC